MRDSLSGGEGGICRIAWHPCVNGSAEGLYKNETVPIGEIVRIAKDFQRVRANFAFLIISTAPNEVEHDRSVVIALTNATASGVQQIASGAEDLNRLTENMQQEIHKFRLGNETEERAYIRAAVSGTTSLDA